MDRPKSKGTESVNKRNQKNSCVCPASIFGNESLRALVRIVSAEILGTLLRRADYLDHNILCC